MTALLLTLAWLSPRLLARLSLLPLTGLLAFLL